MGLKYELISVFATQKFYSFWKTISPWILHPKSYKWSQFVSSMFSSVRWAERHANQQKCKLWRNLVSRAFSLAPNQGKSPGNEVAFEREWRPLIFTVFVVSTQILVFSYKAVEKSCWKSLVWSKLSLDPTLKSLIFIVSLAGNTVIGIIVYKTKTMKNLLTFSL